MIGIDTNVLVRFLLADDPEQHRLAAEFVRNRSVSAPAFVSLVALVETVWILRQVKQLDASAVDAALAALLSTDDFVFEERDFLVTLLEKDRTVSVDLADEVIAHVARRHGCDHVVTFDRRAANRISAMTLLS